MKINEIRDLLKDPRVTDEIHKHLWIESQKAGYSIGLERATDEWLRLYAEGWMRHHLPDKYAILKTREEKLKKTANPKEARRI